MSQQMATARRYIRITPPQSPEEWERVHTLLRLALAVAQRTQNEEGRPQGEVNHDAPEE
jgi:hypothetical protein